MRTIAKLKETKNVEVVLQVKGNQRKLLGKCANLSQIKKPHSTFTQTGKRERNRIEKRTVSVFHKDKYDLGDTWDDSIKALIRIERKTRTFNTTTKKFDTSEETAFYISTTSIFSAKEFGAIIRSHWRVETSNHYVRDVSLREDFSRIRRNPENIAILRSFSLNILRMNHEPNIREALFRNGLNISRVLNYVGVKG